MWDAFELDAVSDTDLHLSTWMHPCQTSSDVFHTLPTFDCQGLDLDSIVDNASPLSFTHWEDHPPSMGKSLPLSPSVGAPTVDVMSCHKRKQMESDKDEEEFMQLQCSEEEDEEEEEEEEKGEEERKEEEEKKEGTLAVTHLPPSICTWQMKCEQVTGGAVSTRIPSCRGDLQWITDDWICGIYRSDTTDPCRLELDATAVDWFCETVRRRYGTRRTSRLPLMFRVFVKYVFNEPNRVESIHQEGQYRNYINIIADVVRCFRACMDEQMSEICESSERSLVFSSLSGIMMCDERFTSWGGYAFREEEGPPRTLFEKVMGFLQSFDRHEARVTIQWTVEWYRQRERYQQWKGKSHRSLHSSFINNCIKVCPEWCDRCFPWSVLGYLVHDLFLTHQKTNRLLSGARTAHYQEIMDQVEWVYDNVGSTTNAMCLAEIMRDTTLFPRLVRICNKLLESRAQTTIYGKWWIAFLHVSQKRGARGLVEVHRLIHPPDGANTRDLVEWSQKVDMDWFRTIRVMDELVPASIRGWLVRKAMVIVPTPRNQQCVLTRLQRETRKAKTKTKRVTKPPSATQQAK